MTSRLYIQKRGPSGGTDIELTDFTGRKGTPFFDGEESIVQLGHRAFNAEASQGTFKLMDPDAELPAADFSYNLPAHALVTWTEDAPGAEVWLSRGRIAQSDGGRGVVLVDDEVDFDNTVDDGNVELRGQAFTEPWIRPEETDVARLIALQAYTLNGASSTATHHRDTCQVTVSASHLAPNTNTVTMPAKKYLPGQQPQDVVRDCADTAGKQYAVVIHHTGGSHLCLLYIVNADHTTYLSPAKISDHLDEWDPEDPSAPVYEPHWEAGKATLYDGQTLLSGMVGVFQAETGIFVEYAGNDESYDYWVEPYYDGDSTTSAQAEDRTAGILEERRLTHVTHRVSIIMGADQVDMVAAGMSIQIKAAAALGGQYLDTYQTRRIAECQFEPRHDGRYWAHLNLDRPPLRVAPGKGSASTAPPQAPTSTIPPTAATDYLWDTFSATGTPPGEDDTGHNIGSGPKYGGGGFVYAGALDSACESEGFTLSAGTYTLTATIRSSSSTGSPKNIRIEDSGGTLGTSSSVGNAAETVSFDFTTVGGAGHQWLTGGPESGRKSEVYFVSITHGSATTGFVGTSVPPASSDQIGTVGTQNIYSPIDHQHPAQSAGVTLIGDEGAFFASEADVESALQVVGAGPRFPEVSLNNRFPVWGHRGDIGSTDSLPENTLESVLQCALKGIQGAEIDVRLSSDGTFHLMHDSTVDRTTDGTGAISSKTDANIAALNVNGGFGYISGSYDVPTLASVLDALYPYDFMLSIQLAASADANATALAEQVFAAGWQSRAILEVSTLTEAARIKEVSSHLTVMVNDTVSGADSDDNVDWLSMEWNTIADLAEIKGKAPKHVKSYISIDDFPADEAPIIQDMWDFGVAAYQTDNIEQSLPLRQELVYGGGSSGVTDHGALTGLGDDDHPQYLTEAEHDVLAHDAMTLVTVDAGVVTYDDSGADVDIAIATVWGIDTDGSYYDDAGAVDGEQAALMYDPDNDAYLLIPYNPA